MRVRASVKPKCEWCQVVVRRGRMRIIWSRTPKHKQTQG